MSGFYRKEERALYVNPAEFHLMTDKELAAFIADGVKLYGQLYPPDKGLNPLLIVAIVVVAVAAVAAIAAAGSAAAGTTAAATASGSTVAAGATAITPAIGPVTAATGASAGSVFSTVQSVASYVSTAGKVYQAATGKPAPDKLMAAADIVGSGSTEGAIKGAVNYQLKQDGLEIRQDDKPTQAALSAMIAREQNKYSGQLRKLAQEEAKNTGRTIAQKQPMTLKDAAPYLVPLALWMMG